MRRGTPIQRAAVRALAVLCAVLAMWLASAERAARAAAMHPPEAAALGGRVGGCPRAEAAKPPSTRCSTCAPRRGAPPLLLYLYEGPNRVGVIERGAGAGYTTKDTYLFAGIDDALRLKRGSQVVYFETDLAGNVRRLRAPGGGDLGGYRYSAFGKTVEDTAAVDQPHRWKGRWYSQVAGGIYDVRARQWSPQVGAFLTLDEFAFHDPKTTLWGWPGQNPVRYRDPSGRYFEKEAAENPVAFGIALSLLPVLWPAAGLAMPLGTGLASDDARMQAAAHPNQSFAEQASMLASVVGMSSVASQGAVACSNRAAIARARAACPGGDCRLLANTLAEQHGGRIRTLEPLPGQGTLPGHPDWLFHEAVETHTGEVLDPLNATTYPSVDAWRRAVVGNAEVNVGARDWPPRNRPPYENF